MYPALHYLLSKREILKKRAYIAKFLSRIELPPEFMHDEQVQEQLQVLRSLQQEFKTAHKAVEQLVSVPVYRRCTCSALIQCSWRPDLAFHGLRFPVYTATPHVRYYLECALLSPFLRCSPNRPFLAAIPV